MAWVLLGIGLVLLIEGLVLALAPGRIEELFQLISQMPVETRRLIGLTAMVIGAALLSAARVLGL